MKKFKILSPARSVVIHCFVVELQCWSAYWDVVFINIYQRNSVDKYFYLPFLPYSLIYEALKSKVKTKESG